jgi:hypothetical protein
MNTITIKITDAFLSGNPKKISNSKTDGRSLWLFENKIAEHREDGLYISNAGWFSRTTKERLSGLPNVTIYQKKKKWYLNGEEWDGGWKRVTNAPPPPVDHKKAQKIFDLSNVYVRIDGWRGYQQPTYAVCGANDTGMWEDSPCKSDIAERELQDAKNILIRHEIPVRKVTTETSNVFCVHHYLIVPPHYIEEARQVMNAYYYVTETKLLYLTK